MTDIAVHDATTLDAIVRLAAGGDQAAFANLVAEHHASMARVAFVITGDPELTRDAVQSAWSIAWRRLHTIRDASTVGAWLIAIAANEARQAIRRQRRRPVVDISTAPDPRVGADPADVIGLLDLQRAFARLKPEDRALLALRYVAGFDSGEIASQLGGSASGVRSRLSRLLDRLRAEIDDA